MLKMHGLQKMVKMQVKVADKDYFAVSDGVDVIYLEGENEKGKEDLMHG